jgi:tetratricopeptide (TPR) repeat protein
MKRFFIFIVLVSASWMLNAQKQIDVEKLLNYAQMATELENYDDAIKYYEQILDAVPDFVDLYREIGNLYIRKGEDVNFLREAILNFKKYLQLKPKAEDSPTVKTTVDKLEYLYAKAIETATTKNNLIGRWASADWVNDIYGRSAFIFDITYINNKIAVRINKSSLYYSNDYTAPVAYAEDAYSFRFERNYTYVPSTAKYDNQRMASSTLSNANGENRIAPLIELLNQSLINAAQENDIGFNRVIVYEFNIEPALSTEKILEMKIRIYTKVSNQEGARVIFDTVQSLRFEKVPSNFTNGIILEPSFKYDVISPQASPSDARSLIKNHPDTKIASKFKTGIRVKFTGAGMVGAGIGGIAVGLVLVFSSPDADDTVPLIMFCVSSGIGLVGIPVTFIGNRIIKNAVSLYNKSLYLNRKNKGMAELNIGFSGNSVGFTLNF